MKDYYQIRSEPSDTSEYVDVEFSVFGTDEFWWTSDENDATKFATLELAREVLGAVALYNPDACITHIEYTETIVE